MTDDQIIKKVTSIELKENEFLAIDCGETASRYQLDAIRNRFKTFMDGKFADRVLVFGGAKVELTKVSKEEL